MTAPLTLVTGAGGRTGGAVATQLREHGVPVRAPVHRPDARSARLQAQGAQVVVADMFDPRQMRAALDGVARAYYVPPWHPQVLQSAVVFAVEARRARLEALVGLSQWRANPAHPSLATRQNWLVERVFELLPDTAHVTVAPGFFADNYLGNGLVGLAAQLGVLPIPSGQGRNAPPSTEDVARVVTAVLLRPEPHAGRSDRPTGPTLLDGPQLAAAVGDAVGRRVRHIDLPLPMFLRALRVMGPRAGIDESQMAEVRWYYQEGALGTWELGAPTTHVRDVAGVEPEEFTTIARRYAARPESRRTAGNLVRAVWDMTRIGFTPAPRLDALVRRQRQPVAPEPELSRHSATWAREHLPGSPARPDPDRTAQDGGAVVAPGVGARREAQRVGPPSGR